MLRRLSETRPAKLARRLSDTHHDMDQHSIKNVKKPADRLDAVNKAYTDGIKYKIATGNIPNTVMTDHTLITFPAAKALLVER